ncbi:MAG: hypothetical protein PHX30_02790 [Candidatus Pacebacteria bacterium]|nr:hypothetical protein [Candidatus Paceibacterota bacterium]
MKSDIYKSGGRLIPLKYSLLGQRSVLEKSSKIKKIISSGILLDADLKVFLEELISINDNLKEQLCKFNEQAFFDKKTVGNVITKYVEKNKLDEGSSEIVKAIQKIKDDITHEDIVKKKQTIKEICQVSDKLMQKLADFNEDKGLDLDLFRDRIIYVCKRCQRIACEGRFQKKECDCGAKLVTTRDVSKISIYLLSEEVERFFKKDLWLEYGIDYLLKRANLSNVFCGYSFLGSSCVYHEVDNFAENFKENIRIVCECKNCKIVLNDAIVFKEKIKNLGASRAYLITTSEDIDSDVRLFCNASNIMIIDSVLGKQHEELLEIIKKV